MNREGVKGRARKPADVFADRRLARAEQQADWRMRQNRAGFPAPPPHGTPLPDVLAAVPHLHYTDAARVVNDLLVGEVTDDIFASPALLAVCGCMTPAALNALVTYIARCVSAGVLAPEPSMVVAACERRFPRELLVAQVHLGAPANTLANHALVDDLELVAREADATLLFTLARRLDAAELVRGRAELVLHNNMNNPSNEADAAARLLAGSPLADEYRRLNG